MFYRGLLVVASFASLAGFLFGYDLGLIGGALLNIRDDFNMSDLAASAVVGAAKFGAFFGTFLGGALMLQYGRRKAIAADSIFFVLGPLIMAASFGITGLVIGRVVVGLGVGISAAVVPAYLGEVAPAKVRGRVVEIYELLLCLGMLGAALGDAAFQGLPGNWRWMVGAPVVPALLLSFSLCLLPESPRWLVIRGRLDDALAVIHRMYTASNLPAGMQSSTAEVEDELMQLWSSVEKDREEAAARRQRYTEQQRRRQEERAAARAAAAAARAAHGSGGAGGAASAAGGWQQLKDAGDDEDPTAAGVHAGTTAEAAAAAEAGAAGVQRRMEEAVARLEAEGGEAATEKLSLLPPGAAANTSSSGGDDGAGGAGGGGEPNSAAAGGGRRPSKELAPASPLKVPAHLPPIRTSVSQQKLAELAGGAPAELATVEIDLHSASTAGRAPAAAGHAAPPVAAQPAAGGGGGGGSMQQQAAAATEWDSQWHEQLDPDPPGAAVAGAAGGGAWGAHGQALAPGLQQQQQHRDDEELQRRQQRLPVTARQGAGEAGLWRTLRDMLGDIYIVGCGPERKALQMALWLAFFNQAFASTSIINYAPEVLERAGVESHAAASLLTSAVGGSKLLGVLLSLFLVDSLGRRPLLLWGSAGCSLALVALAAADWLAIRAFLIAGMCTFIFAFSVSWAGVFWVLLSEVFSMSAKSPATSAATATLFLTGAVADFVFLTLHNWLGPLVFLLFALLAAVAGIYVAAVVPETKGKTLQEVQALLALRVAAGSGGRAGRRGRQGPQEQIGLLPPGALRSDAAAVGPAGAGPGLELQQQQ